MPNWCNNTVEVYHPDANKLKALVEAFNKGEMCNYIKPVPESLKIVAGCVGDPDEQKKLEEATAQNLVDHGYGNWYDYCVNEWGTKWDVGGDGDQATITSPNSISMGFDSAWAPPIAAMEKFQDLGFKVKLIYWESGMCFCGLYDENGDDYYDYSNMTSAELAEEINPEIDECMCIVENMQMWEEENQEEEEENDTK